MDIGSSGFLFLVYIGVLRTPFPLQFLSVGGRGVNFSREGMSRACWLSLF